MNSHETTLSRQAQRTPKSTASVPPAYPPHPPLQSGGWYRSTVAELPGPGRPPVVKATRPSTMPALLTIGALTLLALLLF